MVNYNLEFRRLVKFSIVGVINTIINFAVLLFLTELVGIFYVISAVIAFLAATTNSFFMNRNWTFRYKNKERKYRRFFSFVVLTSLSLLANLIVLIILTEFFGFHYLISQLVGICFSVCINFLGSRIFIFRN